MRIRLLAAVKFLTQQGILWSVAEADAIVICSCLPYIQEMAQALQRSTIKDTAEAKSLPRARSANLSSATRQQSAKRRESHDTMRAQKEAQEISEGELAILPAGLSPTPGERISWSARTPFPSGARQQYTTACTKWHQGRENPGISNRGKIT